MAKKNKKIETGKKENNNLQSAKDLTEKILDLLGLEASVETSEDKENEAVKVQIESEEPGLLIGRHGETISSLQLLLGAMVSRNLGEWTRVMVNVGNWRQTREESLKRMADLAAEKAIFSGQPVALPPLSPSERRFIHIYLSQNSKVKTESEGEGSLRQVMVKSAK